MAGPVVCNTKKLQALAGGCFCHVADGTAGAMSTGDGVSMYIGTIHEKIISCFENS